METTKRYSFKKIALIALWSIVGAGGIVLLVAAMHKKDTKLCKDVTINIEGVKDNFFVDKDDVMTIIRTIANGDPKGKTIGSFNLKSMEAMLEKSTWIKTAELFFDNNDVLKVNINEREPIARVFTTTGTTFYIDSSDMMLPLSEKFPARLPVFTNFPSDKVVLTKADSNLLNDIKILSLAIQQDTFCMALIDQIDITANRTFEMMPKIGNQVIVFGDASDVQEKFYKLKLFYKEVMTRTNWNKYSTINVQYKGQVVAKIKGVEEKTADSLRMQQNMELLVARAQQQAADTSVQNRIPDNDRVTTDSTMIERSIERNDDGQNAMADDNKPAAENKPAVDKPIEPKPVVAKPIENKPATAKPVMAKPVTAKPTKPVGSKPKPAEKPPVAKPKPKPTKPNNDY